jgi:hypothetical protein
MLALQRGALGRRVGAWRQRLVGVLEGTRRCGIRGGGRR